MNQTINILIVEDERIPAEFLKSFLEYQGYKVIGICDRGEDAIQMAQQFKPDVIFMDIMLKDKTSGSEAAVKISSLIETKIIFLTAYFDQEMMDYALEAGAVNYLIKPYKEKQILAALEIALRQTDTKSSKQQTHTSIPLMCDYIYNTQKQRLYRNEKEVSLSKKSLLLIHCLVLNINSTVSKEELSHYIYGENKDSSTIRTLVFRLRKQLECDMIENISGLGYKIVSD